MELLLKMTMDLCNAGMDLITDFSLIRTSLFSARVMGFVEA